MKKVKMHFYHANNQFNNQRKSIKEFKTGRKYIQNT